MSVEQYPRLGFFLVVNNEPLKLGRYELPAGGSLRMVEMRCFHKNPNPFSYTLKLELSTKADGPAVASSNVETFSNSTTGQIGSDWLGNLIFTFSDYDLQGDEPYFLRLVTTGYTRPDGLLQNTRYLAIGCDWLEPIGTANVGGARAAMGVLR